MDLLLQTFVRFFTDEKWPITPDGENKTLLTDYPGQNGKIPCFAHIRSEEVQLSFYSCCPENVPANRRSDMAEFLTRVNYGLHIGNFEFDLDDGEIRYKTSMDVEGLPLDEPVEQPVGLVIVKHLVYHNVTTMDRYLVGILKIIHTKSSPAEVLAELDA